MKGKKYKQVKKTAKSIEEFFAEAEELRSAIDNIAVDVGEIEKLHSAILRIPGNRNAETSELDARLSAIRSKSVEIRNRLKELDAANQEKSATRSVSSADLRIRKTQQNDLLRKFVDVMEKYNEAQLKYRAQCREKIVRELRIATGKSETDLDPEEIDAMIESSNPQIFTQMIIKDSKEAKEALVDIENRYQDILKLESEITEINDLFVDLNTMVVEQGEKVDRIECHVAEAEVKIEEGKKEASSASKKQSRARKTKIICAIVGVVILVIIIVAIALSV